MYHLPDTVKKYIPCYIHTVCSSDFLVLARLSFWILADLALKAQHSAVTYNSHCMYVHRSATEDDKQHNDSNQYTLFYGNMSAFLF